MKESNMPGGFHHLDRIDRLRDRRDLVFHRDARFEDQGGNFYDSPASCPASSVSSSLPSASIF